ncbi:hypothetical protein Tco_1013025 [Tanacetum coccineum]
MLTVPDFVMSDSEDSHDSLGYITESDPKEDPKEEDEDPKEDPADYPDDRDDEEEDEEESFGDDVDDEEEDEEKDEEEEHLALADSVPPPSCRTTARMSIRDQTPIPFPFAADLFHSLSSPLPVSSPPLPASPTYPLGYRAAMIQLRAESPSTSHPLPLPSPIVLPHTKASVAMIRVVAPSTYILAPRSETPPSWTPPLLPISLPTSSPPSLLPSTDCRAGVSNSSSAPTARPTKGFRADYGFVGTLDDEIRRDPKRDVGYGIIDTWDEMVEDMQDTNEIYGRLDDAQDDRFSREAWVQSMDASDTARSEVRELRTTMLAQQAEIGALRAVDHTRQAQLTKALTLLRTLQMQMAVLWSQQTPAREPTRSEIPKEAGSSS